MRVTSRKQRQNKAAKVLTTEAVLNSYGNKKQAIADSIRARVVPKTKWNDPRPQPEKPTGRHLP